MAQTSKDDAHNGFATDMAVGEILRRTREHYGQSPDDVERNLRIRAEQVKAIEENDIEKLPAKVYAIGFVRSYSEYLGLDGAKMVELFKYQTASATKDPVLRFPTASRDGKAPPIWIIVICLILLIAAGGYVATQNQEQREVVESVPEVPTALKSATIEAKQEEAKLAEKPLGPPAPEAVPAKPVQKGIILKMKQNSWVEIRDANNRVLISRVLKAGDQYFVPDNANLTMSLGNAGGVDVSVDGIALAPLGAPAQVVRKVPLSGKSLKSRFGLDQTAQ
ncbi:MAG: helix-turn-helix domain-containing protein [Alphaproteobacteria bacterium]